MKNGEKFCKELTPGSLFSSTKGIGTWIDFSSLQSDDSVELDFSMMFFIGNSLRDTDEDEMEGEPEVGSKSILCVRREV